MNIFSSDFDAPVWGVESSRGREAGGLTFSQAADLLMDLFARDVRGLSIIVSPAAPEVIAQGPKFALLASPPPVARGIRDRADAPLDVVVER